MNRRGNGLLVVVAIVAVILAVLALAVGALLFVRGGAAPAGLGRIAPRTAAQLARLEARSDGGACAVVVVPIPEGRWDVTVTAQAVLADGSTRAVSLRPGSNLAGVVGSVELSYDVPPEAVKTPGSRLVLGVKGVLKRMMSGGSFDSSLSVPLENPR